MSSTATDGGIPYGFFITKDENREVDVETEGLECYGPGGFHPVHLVDLLGPNGRYRVVDKLGHGGWGTVWLCRDELECRWRAVKINATTASHGENDGELKTTTKLLESLGLRIVEGPQKILQSRGIALPINHFTIQGPNGTHLALVYPLLGATLRKVFMYNAPQPELLKDVCFQIAQAMQFLHSNGVCHGDLRPANILFQLGEGVDQWSEEQILDVLGEPKIEQVVILSYVGLKRYPAPPDPSRPEYLVGRNCFDYTSGVLRTSVAISGFGVSFFPNDPPKGPAIPGHLAAPEQIVEGIASSGFASDIWALMNTIVHVRLGANGMAGHESARDVLERCEFVIGPMPQNYRIAWGKMGGDFPNGSQDDPSVPVVVILTPHSTFPKVFGVEEDMLKFSLTCERHTLLGQTLWDAIASQDYKSTGFLPRLPYESPNLVQDQNVMSQLTDTVELEQLYDLCMSAYKWQPEERASMEEILNHPWFGNRNKNNVQGAAALTKDIYDDEETPKNKRTDKNTEASERATDQKPGVLAAEKVNSFAKEIGHLEGVEEDGQTNDQDFIEGEEYHGDQDVNSYGDEQVSYYYCEDGDGAHYYYEDDDGIHYGYGDDDGLYWDG